MVEQKYITKTNLEGFKLGEMYLVPSYLEVERKKENKKLEKKKASKKKDKHGKEWDPTADSQDSAESDDDKSNNK